MNALRIHVGIMHVALIRLVAILALAMRITQEIRIPHALVSKKLTAYTYLHGK